MNFGPINLLVLQATAFCNIDCRYCYVPNRSDKKVMSEEVLAWALRRAFQSGLLAERVDLLWHAGEPLVVGRDFYRNACELIRSFGPQPGKLAQCIQTNATVIDADWCALFQEEQFQVGVSLDGPEDIHDLHRVKRNGRGTFKDVMRGIEALNRNGVPFSALAVLTRESLIRHGEVLDFFEQAGIRDVGFNFEELDSERRDRRFTSAREAETLFHAFAKEALARHLAGKLRIREIGDIQERLRSGGKLPVIHAVPLRFITVGVDGSFSTFCPQLHNARYDDGTTHVFGNVLTDDFVDIVSNPHFLSIYDSIMEGVRMCAQTCSRFGICGSNQVGVKYFENGSYASTETLCCKARVKIIADVIESQERAAHVPAGISAGVV